MFNEFFAQENNIITDLVQNQNKMIFNEFFAQENNIITDLVQNQNKISLSLQLPENKVGRHFVMHVLNIVLVSCCLATFSTNIAASYSAELTSPSPTFMKILRSPDVVMATLKFWSVFNFVVYCRLFPLSNLKLTVTFSLQKMTKSILKKC